MSHISPIVHFVDVFEFKKLTDGWRICYTHSIFLFEAGTGTLFMNNTSYPLFPGVLVYIPAGKPHQWKPQLNPIPLSFRCAYFDWFQQDRSMLDHRRQYFCYDDEPIDHECINGQIPIQIPEYLKVEPLAIWQQKFASFTASPDVLDTFQLIGSLNIQGQFQLFLHFFLNYLSKANDFMDPRIQSIIKRMEKHSDTIQESNIEKLANELGMSRTYFHHLFKKETGISPHRYVTQYRVNLAMQDLRNSNASITNIASRYQFNSLHDFSKVFRKYTGVAPTEYRKKNQL